MERRKFEESWRDAFEQAEFSPAESVWTNIELDLEKAKGSRLKRKLLFYQMLAAACVIFTLGIGIYVARNNSTSEQLAIQQPVGRTIEKAVPPVSDTDLNKKPETDLTESDNNAIISSEERINDADLSLKTGLNRSLDETKSFTAQDSKAQRIIANMRQPTDNTSLFDSGNMLIAEGESDIDALFSPIPESKLPPIAHLRKIELKIGKQQPEPDPVAIMLARLEDRERKVKEELGEKRETENRNENLWTSLGFAAGSFSSVNNSTSAAPQRLNAQPPTSHFASTSDANSSVLASVAEKEAKASGMTYSMGVNVGTKLSERWVIQGGVNYLTQSSDYTQQVLIGNPDNSQFRPAAYNDYRKTNLPLADAKPENLVSTAPYDVNNNIRYLSIPVQAGYLIVNRDFGFQLNAGLSTDLFLQSTTTATANGEKVDPSKADFSENSVFRPVNLSGLMGTEFSYKFGPHYRIALNPGIRYPFNSIYKSDEYSTTRITFDLGLRFRYIFN